MVLSPVHPALRAPLRGGGRGRGLLHRLGAAVAHPDPRGGREFSGGRCAPRAGRRRGGSAVRSDRGEPRAAGEAEGAGRWSANCALPENGFWFAPTIFTGVTQAHRIAREEIFGPVLSVLTFRTPAEAIEKANNTPFGLSAGIWSEKGSNILWATQQLRAGVIWANTFNKFDPASPFGGYKESGWGREGGRHGLSAYLKGSAK